MCAFQSDGRASPSPGRWTGAVAEYGNVLLVDAGHSLCARVVEPDGLEVGEEVRPLFGHLFLAHAGALDAAEGKLRLSAHGGLVDVDPPHFGLLDEAHHLEGSARVA